MSPSDKAAESIIRWMKSNSKNRPERLYWASDLSLEAGEDPDQCLEALVSHIFKGAQVAPMDCKSLSEDAEIALREAPYQYGYAPKKNSWELSQALVDALTYQPTEEDKENRAWLDKQYALTPKRNY